MPGANAKPIASEMATTALRLMSTPDISRNNLQRVTRSNAT